MKPKRVIFVRHGQSEGNLNKFILRKKPDYALNLTPLGWEQAEERGRKLKHLLGRESVRWIVSPYFRTRETFLGLRKAFQPPYAAYEDARLREQDWGNLREDAIYNNIESARDSFGHFYFRLPNGESCADVYDRFGAFLNTLYRDFEKRDCQQTVVLVTHGMTMRCGIARWLHLTVEEFEALANPENCGIYVLQLGRDGKYHLEGEPRRYESPRHPYQFKWPAGGLRGVI